MLNGKKTEKLLACIREGQEMTTREKFNLIVELSIPSMLAQISMVLMFFIDAAMVGHLGSAASASIGLIESTLWLVGSVMSASAIGFAVQVAHFIGAGDFVRARQVFRHALVFGLVFSVVMLLAGVAVHKPLPFWLKGGADIAPMASSYFLVFSFTLPFMMAYHLMADMLKSSGDMRTPSFLSIMMCCLDVAFNYLFIYILHLGVTGAALGTMCAYVLTVVPMARQAMWKSHVLALRLDTGRFEWVWDYIRNALKISLPVAVQSVLMSGAQVVSTRIVAPLGNVAIAANSFAITAESLCYMPGYGIGDAASTLVGQTFGAGRKALCRSFRQLGTGVLRIEAFAEPFFAASIVSYSVCVGAGDTVRPAAMNLASMWCVRLTLAWALAQSYGLRGVWIAMAIELTFRGIIFLLRIARGGWLAALSPKSSAEAV